MVGEDRISEILGYLEKKGPTNTFRLASVIGLERDKLLNILHGLEKIQAIRFEHGNAVFIKFVSGEKPKLAEIQKTPPTPAKVATRKPAKLEELQILQAANKQLQGKLSELKKTVKELEQKASMRPKTITKTITKKVPVIKTVVKEIPAPKPQFTKKVLEKLSAQSKKFKMSRPKLLESIKQLKKPEFVNNC